MGSNHKLNQTAIWHIPLSVALLVLLYQCFSSLVSGARPKQGVQGLTTGGWDLAHVAQLGTAQKGSMGPPGSGQW